MKNHQSDEINRLFEEDQQDRRPDSIDWTVVGPKDKRRKDRIKALYDQGLISTPKDKYHAAMILQHGDRLEDYELANELSTKAMLAGLEPAKWLSAASEDRLLTSQGKPQKYGTQYRQTGDGPWELLPVDPSITDEERAKYNVPPLAESKKRAEEMK